MTQQGGSPPRIGVDIGGTFTDVVLEKGTARYTAKVLTTPRAPEQGVGQGIQGVLADSGVAPGEVALIIHGTTLATNALIERKGVATALVTTQGFRDSIEMGSESRFEQYDINMEKPLPLVPRRRRFAVAERLNAAGEVILALDEAAVAALIAPLKALEVESVAIGFLHSYVNPAHEQRAYEILSAGLPDVTFTLSSEVAPEMREYERFSTACANAYVQPIMAQYLRRLEAGLKDQGFTCPLFVMLSGGGVADIETGIRFPIRLVESGPVGGAIFSSHAAAECGLSQVLSFDMGGTTAKICVINDSKPHTERSFEVARAHRFLKGSGLPLRIPVIQMVEIGAGGGSLAHIDALGRIAVGPESAGAEPGPACYGRGGEAPAVTDADVALGRIDPNAFAGGRLTLDGGLAAAALDRDVGQALSLDPHMAALGISEMVDENMASAARVHAIEIGASLAERTMIAFGGAAPLHAARLAEKLEIDRVLIPTSAAVGSAVGFLRAPVGYQVVRSAYQKISQFDAAAANEILSSMRAEALAVVARGAPGAETQEQRIAYMRYLGQGHEVAVDLPSRDWLAADGGFIRDAFEAAYEKTFGRIISHLDVELVSWAVEINAATVDVTSAGTVGEAPAPAPYAERQLLDAGSGETVSAKAYRREEMPPGSRIEGPAIIVEDDTSTVVSPSFDASINALGYIVLERKGRGGRS
ncbi:MAG: hydantoinase/oxoprolinase family protein [Rhodospirillaceae bacterium]|jgi:N-methylhydantoinase A|nr:hydantoinase/oxoprolinase family protein [Rhodospirillaceae bacterium]MBT5676112.1 hydantoinase/oxoprolinase family protein [Rhodospirillaceae bacterium]MBT5780819.1 hydantoinase/oxoprolinase family protein [Rhodospirillaceae bacterium]MBT7294051.1 hydantoinase/oxoprolinase family protein [Rhodospirillaceae bacterium]